MNEWYYTEDGKQHGPVTLETLRGLAAAGNLKGGDLVWNQSMKDWLPASDVAGVIPTTANASNPYAVSHSALAPSAMVSAGEGLVLEEIEPGSEPIGIMECIKRGFTLTTRHFGVLILAGLVVFGISMAVQIPFSLVLGFQSFQEAQEVTKAGAHYEPGQQFGVLQILNQVISTLVSLYFTAGFCRIGLNLVSGKEATVSQLFSENDKFLRIVGGYLLYILIVLVGLLLLVVPGVYLAYRFVFYTNAIVDRNMSVKEAFSYSWEITQNNVLSLLGLSIMSFFIMLAGVLALCVGILFAMPVIWLAWISSYRWLQYGHRAVEDHPGTTRPVLSFLP